jgi:hypothetical protein
VSVVCGVEKRRKSLLNTYPPTPLTPNYFPVIMLGIALIMKLRRGEQIHCEKEEIHGNGNPRRGPRL